LRLGERHLDWLPPAHFADPRNITVRETARLQGLPDAFRVFGSFANQMEQVTNDVPPPLGRAVFCVLVKMVDLGYGTSFLKQGMEPWLCNRLSENQSSARRMCCNAE
jgi:hypothetical protein